MKVHPLREIIKAQKCGMPVGSYSVCSASDYVIEAAMEAALRKNTFVVIEATANQVNQYGGYTGMQPCDFRNFVYSVAAKVGFTPDRIILGGDHLGPLVWNDKDEAIAMANAKELIRQFVMAGFTKIHIDTSMKLLNDAIEKPLDNKKIAERCAILCKEAEDAWYILANERPDLYPLVYIIGSEVPVPGGSHEDEGLTVTLDKDFEETVEIFKTVFEEYGLNNAWEKVVGVVVQPGVEFSDSSIHVYDRVRASKLTAAVRKHPVLVFEGHSTDYQAPEKLKQMVEDGIAILKVGPGLTFALREALFMLNLIENELIADRKELKKSGFIETLDEAMLAYPDFWQKYYHGSEGELRLARKYSLSDRCRYYLSFPEVKEAVLRLINNLEHTGIPINLLSQYLPNQYRHIREGRLANKPNDIIKDRIKDVIDDYLYAVCWEA